MVEDASKPSGDTRPTRHVPEWLKDKARSLAKLGRALVQAPATEISDERSGLLTPPLTPGGNEQGGEAAKARCLPEETAAPSPADKLREPSRSLPMVRHRRPDDPGRAR